MSVDFTLSGAQVVEEAFKLIGVKTQEQPLTAAQLQDGLRAINLMFKNWQNQGLHLWTKTEGVLFIIPGKTQYFLGPTGDNATTEDDFINTALASGASVAATALNVTSTVGMTAGDFIGIQLDDGSRQWTTINTVVDTENLTIIDPLTDNAAQNNTVFTYTEILQRPLRILGVRRANTGSTTEIQVDPFESRSDYFNQPNKSDQGTINQYFYTPELGNGRIYLWQTGQSVNDFVRFTFERPIRDIDVNDDNPDFPIEWYEVIIYNLGVKLGIEYNTPKERLDEIRAEASTLLEGALGFDTDPLFMQLQPSTR